MEFTFHAIDQKKNLVLCRRIWSQLYIVIWIIEPKKLSQILLRIAGLELLDYTKRLLTFKPVFVPKKPL